MNFLHSLLILLAGLLMHLFLLSFGAAGDDGHGLMLLRGFGISGVFYLFFWWHRSRRLRSGDRAVLRLWYLDCVFLTAFPAWQYLAGAVAMPRRALLGTAVLFWQNRALYRSSRLTAWLFMRGRLGIRRLLRENADAAAVIPGHLNSWCLTAAAAMALMMAYNGGQSYAVSPPPLATWARWLFTAGTLAFLWCRCVLALHRSYWLPTDGAGQSSMLRALRMLQHLPWPFWMLLASMLPLAAAVRQGLGAWVVPTALGHLLCGCLFLHYAGGRPSRFWGWLLSHPAHLLAASFVQIIACGAYLLSLPCCDPAGEGLAVQDALFTATSAVCVTGLSVIDIATQLTGIGQLILAVLIQLGSLGIMTVGSFIALSFGHRLGVLESSALQDMTGEERGALAKRLIRTVILLTLSIEAIGTAAMTGYFLWAGAFGRPADALRHGAFLTLNAFCNSGFSTLPDSCCQLRHDAVPLLILSALITIGGLGYHVIANLWSRLFDRRPLRLPAHVKLILWVSAILTMLGTVVLFIAEYDNTLVGLSLGQRGANALFQSVSCRTAGFNSVPVNGMKPVSQLTSIFLMFCGGAPASNAGGIRVTTVGILAMLIVSIIRGRREVVVFQTTVSDQTIRQAAAVLVTAMGCVFTATLLLSAHMPQAALLDILFEAVSAIGTVGLSTGLTTQLDLFGKIVIITLMLAGRVGFLTLLAMMRTSGGRSRIHYPANRIMIG